MAALQDPNPYELRPQPTPHAEPGHVHRFALREGALRCVYCNVQETLALRAENARLQRRVRDLEDAMLAIYRLPACAPGSKLGGITQARKIASDHIALADWRDEQRGNDKE